MSTLDPNVSPGCAIGPAHFRALAATTSSLTLLLDEESNIVEAISATPGAAAAQFAGPEWIEAFDQEDRPRLRKLIASTRQGDGPRKLRVQLWSQRHKAFRDMEVSACRIAELDGPAHILLVAVDLTPARQAEDEFKRQLAAREATVREHKVRLRELNHRVKNDLQLVSGFLNKARSAASTDSKPAFEAASQRIGAIAQVYDRLAQLGEGDNIDMRELLKALAADATKSLELSPHVEAAPIEVSSSLAMTIALVVNELLLNVAKHAYGPKDARPVKLTARKAAGALEIVVADSGRGLPEGQDPLKLPRAGAQIVLSLVSRMGGRISFQPASPGTEARVLLPLS